MPPKISDAMSTALAYMALHDSRLIRVRGGFWTGVGETISADAVPSVYFGIATLEALRARGLVVVSARIAGYATAYDLTPAGVEAARIA